MFKGILKEVEQLKEKCKRCQNPKHRGGHTCIRRKPKNKRKEDLTKLTDEALETRIFYSQDARAGEPFSPLFDEYKRRYDKLKEVFSKI